jgi:acyl carrier protein
MERQVKETLKRKEIFGKLVSILLELNGLTKKKDKITESTYLRRDLGLDSLDQYEFAYLVEEEFNIRIPDEKAIVEFETFSDYINYIQSCKK